MYQGKKIGVFVSHIFGVYQRRVCQGIIDRAKEIGAEIELYASLLDGEELGDYSAGELSVLTFPDFSQLDGVIFLSGTYLSQELKNRITALLSEHPDCPVIDITNEKSDFPSIYFDNNTMIGDIADHLIEVHDAERLCFLGCAGERQFSDKREAAFRESLKKHSIELDESDIILSSYDEDKIWSALSRFTEKGLPDAVICYNDRMAYSLIKVAAEHGYKVPEDFAVTGCDNLVNSGLMTPALTTVTFPVEALGAEAIDRLRELLASREIERVTTVSAKPLFRCSCGCADYPQPESIFLSTDLNRHIDTLEKSIIQAMHLSAELQGIDDIDLAMDTLAEYAREYKNIRSFYLCLYDGWDAPTDEVAALMAEDEASAPSDTVSLMLGMRDGKRLPECSFKRGSLLPPHSRRPDTSCHLFLPLYFGQRVYGYIAFSYDRDRLAYYFRSVQSLMNLNKMLRSIQERHSTTLLVRRLEELYLRDPLTGLYDRQGFGQTAAAILRDAAESGTQLCFIALDVTGLREINTENGYDEGDLVLKAVGQAIKNTVPEGAISGRFASDEFHILFPASSGDEVNGVLSRIDGYLKNYVRTNDKPYQIAVHAKRLIFTPDASMRLDQVYDSTMSGEA